MDFEPGETVRVAPENDALHGWEGEVVSEEDGLVKVHMNDVPADLFFESDELEPVEEDEEA